MFFGITVKIPFFAVGEIVNKEDLGEYCPELFPS
jgi:hypothetical protein